METMQFVSDPYAVGLSSLSVLYLFLPAVLGVFLLTPVRRRPVLLLAASVLYVLYIDWRSCLVMLGSVGLDYAAVRLMDRWDGLESRRLAAAAASVGKNILFIITAGALLQIYSVPLYLGMIIYCLSAVGAVVRMQRREIPCETNPVRFGLYCCFFPRLYAGPLAPYESVVSQFDGLEPNGGELLHGAGVFVMGAVKLAVPGSMLAAFFSRLKGFSAEESTVLSAWCAMLALAMAVYYILSGYGDMARGLAGMTGLRLPQNFYYPYQSRSVGDFFERFNSSYHAFLNRMVYHSLQKRADSRAADILSLLVVGMLAGIWFGMRLNYLLWGVYLTVFAALEKYLLHRLEGRMPLLLRRLLTLAVVLSSFTILAGDSLGQSLAYIVTMFRFSSDSVALYNNKILYLIASNWLLLALSCFFCTNLASLGLAVWKKHSPKSAGAVSVLVGILAAAGLTALAL